MGDFRRFLVSTPASANLLGFGTLVAWVVKAGWLDTIATDYTWMPGLARVVDGILSGILAGYIFYLFFALYPEHRTRRALMPFILKKTSRVVGDCAAISAEVEKASGHGIPFWGSDRKMVEQAFKNTPMNNKPNIIGTNNQPLSWMEFFMFRQQRTRQVVDDLFQVAGYVPSDLMFLIAEIRDNPFFGMVQQGAGQSLRNTDLDAWGPSFARYREQCRALARWHDRHLAPGINALSGSIV